MDVLLIHLSDIHFKNSINSILDKREKLFDVVKNTTTQFKEIFIIVSGDIAFSGQDDEYNIAKDFITELRNKIAGYSKLNVSVLLIPGNHDCNFALDNKARTNQIQLITQLGDTAIDDSVVEQCSSVQQSYFTFREKFLPPTSLVLFDNILITIIQHTINERKIVFYLYNTSFISQLKERPGQMHFPLSLLPDSISEIKADLSISLFHHPLNWLNPVNRREFYTHIHKTSDFYLTGHEHEMNVEVIDDLKENSVVHFEGSALQDSENDLVSEFHLLGIDMEKQSFKSKHVTWDDERKRYSQCLNSKSEWVSYQQGKLKLRNKFRNGDDFKRFLEDIGGQFTHPYKSNIILSDLFVFPKVRDFSAKNTDTETVSYLYEDSEAIVENIDGDCKLLFFGEENIGKTSLLKMCYRHLLGKGKLPLYISAHRVKNKSITDFNDLLCDAFLQQYPDIDLEDFEQEDKKNIFVLIDDWDKVEIKNQKVKGRLFRNIITQYSNVIFTGNELIPLEEIISDELVDGSLFADFKQCQIVEFNYSKKTTLIHKWYTLGQADNIDENEVLKKCDHAYKMLNVAMGQRIVPNCPIFLLILLQSIESTNAHNLQTSTYSNYYQVLILRSITERIKDPSELTIYLNYTAELANYFFTNSTRIITELEFQDFHKEIVSFEKLDIQGVSYERALKVLVDVGILEKYNSHIEFKYQYTYYFFQARYLSENIRKPEIRELIGLICKKLYRTEHANIIMFLVHFSRDEFIIDELAKNAQEIFSDIAPCQLEKDVAHLESLVDEIPKLYLKNISVEEARREEGMSFDLVEEELNKKNEVAQLEEEDEDSEITIISKLNLSFKLLEILGQVLKNTHGVLPGPIKYSLLKDVYKLGLRNLSLFFSIFEDNNDYFLDMIRDSVVKLKKPEEEKIEKVTRGMLLNVSSQLSFMFLRKISDSVGSNKMLDKYTRVEEELNYSSVKLINFLISLDFTTGFPDRDLTRIKNHIEKYPIAYFILKNIVVHYLHRHKVDYKDKQRICSILGIDIESQLRLEAKQSEK